MTIVVTGAAGFLGVHLVKELAAADHHVIGVDLTAPADLAWAYLGPLRGRVLYSHADVGVQGSLSDAVTEPVDAVIHAAAVTSTAEADASLYGPMERPTGSRTVISPIYALVRAAAAKRSVRISRPEVMRDWTYAVDVARGLRLLVESPVLPYDCYNLSCGKATSLVQIADALAGIVPGFSWSAAEAGQAEIEGARISGRGPLDISRLRELGFAPQYTLRDGLNETLTWVEHTGA